jgi:hypothetical protein
MECLLHQECTYFGIGNPLEVPHIGISVIQATFETSSVGSNSQLSSAGYGCKEKGNPTHATVMAEIGMQ